MPLSHVITLTPLQPLLKNKVHFVDRFHLPLEVVEGLVPKPCFEAQALESWTLSAKSASTTY